MSQSLLLNKIRLCIHLLNLYSVQIVSQYLYEPLSLVNNKSNIELHKANKYYSQYLYVSQFVESLCECFT